MSGASDGSEFGKDLGLMHELAVTGRKLGFTAEDWGKLAHDNQLLTEVRALARKQARIHYVIDCDATPFIPEGFSIHPKDQIRSVVHGQFEFDSSKVILHLDGQKNDQSIIGHELKKRLEGHTVLPANVLDFLLANSHLIPESWKVTEQNWLRYIDFWGTNYRDSEGRRHIRSMDWGPGRWVSRGKYIGDGFDKLRSAALLAS